MGGQWGTQDRVNRNMYGRFLFYIEWNRERGKIPGYVGRILTATAASMRKIYRNDVVGFLEMFSGWKKVT